MAFEKKQDAMQKMLIDGRDWQRKMAEDRQAAVKKEQPDTKIQAHNEADKEKKNKKLFPDSALFNGWGENLSEEDQKEAEALFHKYGYNVFLSDRLPLDRELPDTREPRYKLEITSCNVRSFSL